MYSSWVMADQSTYTDAVLLLHNLVDLLDHLVDPNLDLLLDFLSMSFIFLTFPPIGSLFFTLGTPSVPLVDESFPVSDQFGANVRFLYRVFLLEYSGVFPEGSTDLTLLFFRQERAWARSPEKLFESIEDVFLELLASEIPDRVTVLELLKKRVCRCMLAELQTPTVCRHALALVTRYRPLGSHSTSVTP